MLQSEPHERQSRSTKAVPGIVLLSLLSAYVYSSINRAAAHQSPHALPAAHCPLTTKQQDTDIECSGHKGKRGRNCSRCQNAARHFNWLNAAHNFWLTTDFVNLTCLNTSLDFLNHVTYSPMISCTVAEVLPWSWTILSFFLHNIENMNLIYINNISTEPCS